MKKILVALVVLFLPAIGCAPTRPAIDPGVIPEPRPLSVTDEQYGHEVLQALTDRYELDYNNPRMQTVQNIVERLTHAAKADKDPWHVYILKDDTVKNAAATRGNHVFIWTGMLNVANSDAELATVISHEIAHILAGHTDPDPNEEIKQLLINIGAVAAGIAVAAATRSPQWGNDLGNLTSSVAQELGNGLLVYPYSRDRESEADHIGLFMMADAKYNPQAAVDFWSKVPENPDFHDGLTFLSTHPPAEERLERLRALLPQAFARYDGRTAPLTQDSGKSELSSTNDTFALSQNPQNGITSQWRVKTNRAFLYQSAGTQSKKLGEFRREAVVQIVREFPTWIEISVPDQGFLKKTDVEKIQ